MSPRPGTRDVSPRVTSGSRSAKSLSVTSPANGRIIGGKKVRTQNSAPDEKNLEILTEFSGTGEGGQGRKDVKKRGDKSSEEKISENFTENFVLVREISQTDVGRKEIRKREEKSTEISEKKGDVSEREKYLKIWEKGQKLEKKYVSEFSGKKIPEISEKKRNKKRKKTMKKET